MNCASCRFYYAERSECRRYPPVTQWVESTSTNERKGYTEDASFRSNAWPDVEKNDFCGEYKLLEQVGE